MPPVAESRNSAEPTGRENGLRSIDAAIDRAQAIARCRRGETVSVVDEFIAERREDAARE